MRTNQKTALAYKIATATTETIAITQDSEVRTYTNLVAITGGQLGTFSGFTTQAEEKTITANKPSGAVLWVVSSSLWLTSPPCPLWTVSNYSRNALLQMPDTTQPRCLTALDESTSSTVTFTAGVGNNANAALACASLTILGIDNFCF